MASRPPDGQHPPAAGAPGVQAPSPSPPSPSGPRRGCHSPLSASKRPQARQEPQREPCPAGGWEEEGGSGHPGAAATENHSGGHDNAGFASETSPSARRGASHDCRLIHPDTGQCSRATSWPREQGLLRRVTCLSAAELGSRPPCQTSTRQERTHFSDGKSRWNCRGIRPEPRASGWGLGTTRWSRACS